MTRGESSISLSPVCAKFPTSDWVTCKAATFTYSEGSDHIDIQTKSCRYNSDPVGALPAISCIPTQVMYTNSLYIKIVNGEIQAFLGPLHGEININFPTILQQVRNYDNTVKAEDIDLRLLDGCINDVGAIERITNPDIHFPELEREINKSCYEGMKILLTETSSKFVNAKIIVTGYFQLITENSKPHLKNLWEWMLPYFHSYTQIVNLFYPVLGLPLPSIILPVLSSSIGEDKIDQIADNWNTFNIESAKKIQQAIKEINANLPCNNCYFSGERISFVLPQFGKSNGIFSENSFFYGFNKRDNIGIRTLGPLLYYEVNKEFPISFV